MGQRLIGEDAFAATTFVVIDFETTTPRGRRPEPIEVAVLSLHVQSDDLVETARFTALMCPPAHAPITEFDAHQTGITTAMVAAQPSADDVLARLDRRFTRPPYLLVAHNAPTEAGILYDYRQHCPRLASLDILDTVRMARHRYPDLPNHQLDTLLACLDIPIPRDRHRALADIEVTAQLFTRMVTDNGHRWSSLRELRASACHPARANQPTQQALFG